MSVVPDPSPASLYSLYSLIGHPPSSTDLSQLSEIEVVVEVTHFGWPGESGLTHDQVSKTSE